VIEVHQYREVLYRVRQGQSARFIERAKTAPVGRKKVFTQEHLDLFKQWVVNDVRAAATHSALQRSYGLNCHYSALRRMSCTGF
jgi:hypothetical protein